MLKIGIVIPYFGKFPNYFELFLKSCEKNPTIDWLIFTDIKTEYKFPPNVHKIYITFKDLKKLFQSKFEISIALETPYKLCDYKVMLGYLLSEYLKEYDYWGYSDVDLLFGNIRKFLPDERVIQYDKVGHLGHLTLYRNTDEINKLFMKPIHGQEFYRKVISSNHNFVFDEWFGTNINEIFVEYNKSVWFCNDFFDVEAYEENFHRIVMEVRYDDINGRTWNKEKEISFASWENGKVYQWKKNKNQWQKKEYMYVHFQKRKMKVCINLSCGEKFLCVPNQFIPYKDNISKKYLISSIIKEFLNVKRWKHTVKEIKYKIIELTGPIRHVLKRKGIR